MGKLTGIFPTGWSFSQALDQNAKRLGMDRTVPQKQGVDSGSNAVRCAHTSLMQHLLTNRFIAANARLTAAEVFVRNGCLHEEAALRRGLANSLADQAQTWNGGLGEEAALQAALAKSAEEAQESPDGTIDRHQTDTTASGIAMIPGQGMDKAGNGLVYAVINAEHTAIAHRIAEEDLAHAQSVAPQDLRLDSSNAAPASPVTVEVPAKTVATGDHPINAAFQARIHEETERLRQLNDEMGSWLVRQNIEVVPNHGGRNARDCLLMSVLQHVSGNYDGEHAEAAAAYRRLLPELGEDMLHADTHEFKQLVDTLNRDYPGANMRVVVIQAQEGGKPCVFQEVGTGANPVVVWHQGAHYEALRMRDKVVTQTEL